MIGGPRRRFPSSKAGGRGGGGVGGGGGRGRGGDCLGREMDDGDDDDAVLVTFAECLGTRLGIGWKVLVAEDEDED